MRTANEDADTGGTTAGSVVITTKRGTNEWHGSGAFYERAAALNARFPIENPAPNPKQPFSRQNYVATLGGPIAKNKIWVFSSFEYVHENASIAYSPASTHAVRRAGAAGRGWPDSRRQLHRRSAERPDSLPRLHRIAALRLDAVCEVAMVSAHFRRQLPHSQRAGAAGHAALDRTDHAQQLLEHSDQQHLRDSVQRGWARSSSTPANCTSRRRATRLLDSRWRFLSANIADGLRLRNFRRQPVRHPDHAFPELRNQQKYQLRYDVSHATGDHAFKFGVNFIHEPVLSGALSANAETLYTFPQDPTYYVGQPASVFLGDSVGWGREHARRRRQFLAKCAAAGALCRRFLAGLAPPHGQLRPALSNDLWPIHRLGTQPG